MAVTQIFTFLSRRIIWLACLLWLGPVSLAQTELAFSSATEPQPFHIVHSGETLWGIAQKYDLEVEELKRLNELASNDIYSGQRLLVSTQSVQPGSAANFRFSNEGMASRGAATRRVARPEGSAPSGTPAKEGMLSSEGTPSAEEVWVRHHLNMLNPDGQTSPLIEQSYFERRERLAGQHASPRSYYGSNGRREQPGSTRGYNSDGGSGRRMSNRVYHQVQEGESIYQIAQKYGVRPQQIRRWNRTQAVYAGQTLRIELEEANRLEEPAVDLSKVENILAGDQPSLSTSRSAPSTSTSASEESSSDANRRVVRGQSYKFAAVTARGATGSFYALHATHPIGSKVKIAIPGQSGVLELTIIGRMDRSNSATYGFSPLVVELLEAAGARGKVTLLEEPQSWLEP